MKFHDIISKGSADIEHTRNSRVTLPCDLDLESRLLGYVLGTPSY